MLQLRIAQGLWTCVMAMRKGPAGGCWNRWPRNPNYGQQRATDKIRFKKGRSMTLPVVGEDKLGCEDKAAEARY